MAPQSKPAQILARAAAAKAEALKIDTSRTEDVTVADLKAGDIITRLGNTEFPFPFTLSAVKQIGAFGTMLTATHGWFSTGPVRASETVTRVI